MRWRELARALCEQTDRTVCGRLGRAPPVGFGQSVDKGLVDRLMAICRQGSKGDVLTNGFGRRLRRLPGLFVLVYRMAQFSDTDDPFETTFHKLTPGSI